MKNATRFRLQLLASLELAISTLGTTSGYPQTTNQSDTWRITLRPTRPYERDPAPCLSVDGFHGPMLVGVHGSDPSDWAVTGAGGAGGVAHGAPVKSKKSSMSGCAPSWAVRCEELPIKRLSTNLITAV